MKTKTNIIALLVVIMCLTACGQSASKKTVGITVDFGNGTTKSYSYTTERENLGDLLTDEKLIEATKGQYGLFITAVDGVKADEGKEQWWKITRDGEMVLTGVSTTVLRDGDKFELTLETGYNTSK